MSFVDNFHEPALRGEGGRGVFGRLFRGRHLQLDGYQRQVVVGVRLGARIGDGPDDGVDGGWTCRLGLEGVAEAVRGLYRSPVEDLGVEDAVGVEQERGAGGSERSVG